MAESAASPADRDDPLASEIDDPTALVIADRLAALGTLVAGVAHEINNPITYVLGNLGELERIVMAMRNALAEYKLHLRAGSGGTGSGPLIQDIESKIEAHGGVDQLDELLADATEGAMRIRDLVRDLLSLSRSADRTTTPVNVEEILESTVRLVSRALTQNARVERDFRATRLIEGDRAKLGQVFLNLITNAIGACVRGNDRDTITIRTYDRDDGICVDVEDTGGGIPDEIRKKIFSPFFTTKAPGSGTGLGLYITRRIVEDHGGLLTFKSESQVGTVFTIALPERADRPLGSANPPSED